QKLQTVRRFLVRKRAVRRLGDKRLVRIQEGGDDAVVLFGKDRTGGIVEMPAPPDVARAVFQNGALHRGQVRDTLLRLEEGQIGIFRNGAEARTGYVAQ